MKLQEFLRDEMLDFAARELPEPREDELAADIARDERRRLLQRLATAGVALLVAFLLAWHFAPGAMRRGNVRIEHHGPATTLPAPHRAATPPRQPATATNAATPGQPLGAGVQPSPTTIAIGDQPRPPVTFPVKPVTPPVVSDQGDMWAIASEARDNNGSPMLVVFGLAPAGHHVTVSSTLGSRTYAINNQGDFRWTHSIGAKPPAFPMTCHVQCDGCGSADLSIASYDRSPSQPAPAAGFSAFVATDAAPATFVFGGFEPANKVSAVSVSSPYGGTQFRIRHNTYGGRVTFANAPLNRSFTVDVSAGGETVHLTVARTR